MIDDALHCLIRNNFYDLIVRSLPKTTKSLIDENTVGRWEVDFQRPAFNSNSESSEHVPENVSTNFIWTGKNNSSSPVRNVWKSLDKMYKSIDGICSCPIFFEFSAHCFFL